MNIFDQIWRAIDWGSLVSLGVFIFVYLLLLLGVKVRYIAKDRLYDLDKRTTRRRRKRVSMSWPDYDIYDDIFEQRPRGYLNAHQVIWALLAAAVIAAAITGPVRNLVLSSDFATLFQKRSISEYMILPSILLAGLVFWRVSLPEALWLRGVLRATVNLANLLGEALGYQLGNALRLVNQIERLSKLRVGALKPAFQLLSRITETSRKNTKSLTGVYFVATVINAATAFGLCVVAASSAIAFFCLGIISSAAAINFSAMIGGLVLLLGLKVLVLWYRVQYGYFGTNAYEARQIIDFVRTSGSQWLGGKPRATFMPEYFPKQSGDFSAVTESSGG